MSILLRGIARVQRFGERVHKICATHPVRVVVIGAVLVTVFLTCAVTGKYIAFDYNGLDLAIYTQVMWNTVHGAPFAFTIHPHSYLGDHMELILLALAPLFAIAQHPLTLLVVQILALVSSVWPAWIVFRRRLSRPLSVFLSLGLLLTPFLWNTALFEFHALAFALPLLFWVLVWYEQQRYGLFVLFAAITLLVREDMGLIIAGIGLVAAVERRSIKWILMPIIAGGSWFIAATKISGYLSGYGTYKFLAYYGKLGNSMGDILKNLALHPWIIIQHFLGFREILFMLGLFLPVFFLPLSRPKWLVPILPPLFAFLLSSSNAEIILRIHYPIAMVPFLFLATRDALAAWTAGSGRYFRMLVPYRGLAFVAVGIAFVYSFLVMSPVIGLIRDLPGKITSERAAALRAVSAEIPRTGGVAAGYDMLAHSATRKNLVSLHYVFSGKRQFSDIPYEPVPVETLVLDPHDILFYNATNDPGTERYAEGLAHIRAYAEAQGLYPAEQIDGITLWESSQNNMPDEALTELPQQANPVLATPHRGLALLGWETPRGVLLPETRVIGSTTFATLPLTLYWQKTEAIHEFRFFRLTLTHGDTVLHKTLYPVALQLSPALAWEQGSIHATTASFLIPAVRPDDVRVFVTPVQLENDLMMNSTGGIRSVTKTSDEGDPIFLGPLYSEETE